jgi:hypothetical protein
MVAACSVTSANMKALRTFIRLFRNFYFVTFAAALVWIFFFDRYNVLSRIETELRIGRLEADIRFYQNEKGRLEGERLVLENDLGELERYARERYHMKRDNEDLFLLVRKKEAE